MRKNINCLIIEYNFYSFKVCHKIYFTTYCLHRDHPSSSELKLDDDFSCLFIFITWSKWSSRFKSGLLSKNFFLKRSRRFGIELSLCWILIYHRLKCKIFPISPLRNFGLWFPRQKRFPQFRTRPYFRTPAVWLGF